MMLAEEVIEKAVEICGKYSAKQVILYGSRAKGTQTERSDIDLAVSGVGDFDSLAQEIEEIPTLYTIDLLNLEECGNQLLLEDIKQYGRKIYEKI